MIPLDGASRLIDSDRWVSTGGLARYFEDWKRARTPPGAERCHLGMGTQ